MSIIKWLFSNLLVLLVLVLLVTIRAGYEVLKERTEALTDANGTISTLQLANQLMAEDLETLSQKESGLRVLLKHQNAALADLDQQNRTTANELQHALATPPADRPDCAREPLPGNALRLLKPAAAHRDNHPGGQAPAVARAGPSLPGT